MNPNKYSQRLQWYQRSSTKEYVYGESMENFAYIGDLWGYVEFSGGGQEQDDYGVRRELCTAIIYVNQWPNLTNLDRLVDKRFGDIWYIDAVVRNYIPIELRLTCTRKPAESVMGVTS